eukprot:14873341-Alexandrium_andersonii.AAC.1
MRTCARCFSGAVAPPTEASRDLTFLPAPCFTGLAASLVQFSRESAWMGCRYRGAGVLGFKRGLVA